MKYYSEKLDKLFDNERELRKAETQYYVEQAEKEQQLRAKQEAEEKEKAKVSKEKKEYAKAVEDAETALNQAYAEYEIAKDKVKEILEKSNQEALDILNPAREAITKAQQAKYEAVVNFNKKFGPYTTVYTGDRAFNELKRKVTPIESLFDKLWF